MNNIDRLESACDKEDETKSIRSREVVDASISSLFNGSIIHVMVLLNLFLIGMTEQQRIILIAQEVHVMRKT